MCHLCSTAVLNTVSRTLTGAVANDAARLAHGPRLSRAVSVPTPETRNPKPEARQHKNENRELNPET